MNRACAVLLACLAFGPFAASGADRGATESALRAGDLLPLLSRSEFRFRAPDASVHRAHGPFVLEGADAEGLHFAASAGPGEPRVRVTVSERDERLWARFAFPHHEFLIRLQ